MVFLKEIVCHVLVFIILIDGHKGLTQDQTTTRPNTLFDDADDIQPQLNNEARAKMMFGNTKAVWVFHLPTDATQAKSKSSRHYRHFNIFHGSLKKTKPPNKTKEKKNWSYKDQTAWYKNYPDCGGRSQSPVDLPAVGLIKTKSGRQLSFINYEIKPIRLKFENYGKRFILYGDWPKDQVPVVYGGAAHSRRYLFHSMTLHWPSEHRVGGLQYPFETQVIHISAEHRTLQDAINAAPHDSQAILGIVNLYKFSNYTQRGLSELLRMANNRCTRNCVCNIPLACFNPPLSEHICYQGSLTSPPCTENVLWLVRARALPITRESVEMFNNLFGEGEPRGSFIRQPQPLNDRKVYFIN